MAIKRTDSELCNGCRICVKICPMDVFRMDEKNKKTIIKYPVDCMLCMWCALDCPTKAITVSTRIKSSPLMVSWG